MKGSCTRYATKDCTCSSDLKCAFGSVCANPGDGTMKCIEQYSVKAGSKASVQDVCESGFSKNGTCYDTKMKEEKEYKDCRSDFFCVIEILDGKGNVIEEGTGKCEVTGSTGYYRVLSSTSKQWKNMWKHLKK